MAVIRYFYSAGSLKRVSLFLVLAAALFSLAGPALAGEAAPPTPETSVAVNDTPQPTRQILIESRIIEGKSDSLGKLEVNLEGGSLAGLADGSGRLAFGRQGHLPYVGLLYRPRRAQRRIPHRLRAAYVGRHWPDRLHQTGGA